MARKASRSRFGVVKLTNGDSPSAEPAGRLPELGSVLLLVAADAFLGMISTLVLGVVLELVVLLPAFVFQTLALSSAFFVTSASASVTCLRNSNANFLCTGTEVTSVSSYTGWQTLHKDCQKGTGPNCSSAWFV